ncbi:DNA polymerase III subunit delta [Alicyclobacillus sp. ALC3]|uniref:DNA polymerase III subunit delta n=1 Tax=Alicyclobacillus sp. ALC3 TaxID=2796143 RepID=UPI002378DA81|nr:DNA polymerase III subunit delta [Alicyclobacillus sp. ALC3]WDL96322.1 DNA polymerase III subunit delta [Alicyclobacillus sp. ALC3]
MADYISAREAVGRHGAAPVYVLFGTEPYLMKSFIAAVARQLGGDDSAAVDINHHSFEDEGCQPAVAGCQTVSLFASASVEVLDNCTALLSSTKAKQDKADTAVLEEYIVNPMPGHVLVVTAYGEKLDERKKLVKTVRGHATVVDCNTPNEAAAEKILKDLIAGRKISVSAGVLTDLYKRSGTLSMAVSDLEKVATYAGGRTVTMEDVAEVVTALPEDNIFAWIDLVLRGRADEAIGRLDDLLLAGNDIFAILALLARQWRLVARAKEGAAKREAQRDTAARLGVHPYALKVASEQGERLSLQVAEDMLLLVADAEWALKTGRREPRQTLEWLVLVFASVRGPGRRIHA